MVWPISRLGITLGILLLALPVNSQTQVPLPSEAIASDPAALKSIEPTEEVTKGQVAPTNKPVTDLSELELCTIKSKKYLKKITENAAQLTKLKQDLDTALAKPPYDPEDAEKLNECVSDNDIQRQTSIDLNENLQNLEGQLAKAQTEIARLTARLNEKGIGLVAGFRYFGKGPSASFMNLSDVSGKVEEADRLDLARCADAIGWTETLKGQEKPLRRQIWVWDAGNPKLCARDAAGAAILTSPSPTDEAHVLIFQ
jgi:hypothetical protein